MACVSLEACSLLKVTGHDDLAAEGNNGQNEGTK
jgi:hypothetical protein